jgi:hypothetical protein
MRQFYAPILCANFSLAVVVVVNEATLRRNDTIFQLSFPFQQFLFTCSVVLFHVHVDVIDIFPAVFFSSQEVCAFSFRIIPFFDMIIGYANAIGEF